MAIQLGPSEEEVHDLPVSVVGSSDLPALRVSQIRRRNQALNFIDRSTNGVTFNGGGPLLPHVEENG